MRNQKPSECKLCQRERPVTFHHLIPRTVHKNKWFKKNYTRDEMCEGVYLCRDCHSAVHRFVPNEKELGRDYATLEKLLTHPEIARFVEWVAKRDTKRVRTRMPNDAAVRGRN